MFWKKELKRIPLLIAAVILSTVTVSEYLSCVDIDAGLVGLLFLNLLFVLLWEAATYNKITAVVFAGATVLYTIASFVYIPVIGDMASNLNAAAVEFYLRLFWNEYSSFLPLIYINMVVSIFVSFTVYIFYARVKSMVLVFIEMLAYFFCLDIFFDIGEEKFFIYILITVVALTILFLYKNYGKCTDGKALKKWLKYGVPLLSVLLAVSIAFSLFGEKTSGRLSSALENFIDDVRHSFSLEGMKSPDFIMDGFERDGKVGGNANLSDKHNLYITVYKDNSSIYFNYNRYESRTVYLKGSVCDYYEDREWLIGIEPGTDRNLDEFFFNNEFFSSEGRTGTLQYLFLNSSCGQPEMAIIEPDGIKTDVMFIHNHMTGVEDVFPVGIRPCYDTSQNVFFRNGSNAERYTLKYMNVDRNNSFLRDALSSTPGYGFNFYKEEIDDDVAARIEQYYLQIPEEIPDSVRTLSNTITSGIYNDFEKALAIEAFLKQNYSYTLSPGSIPEDKEFISYFLFENPRGYCTYYATAMVILLRCQGIPARYVKGYRVDNVEEGERLSVKGENLHAWVEAFVPNVGWLTFDPVAAGDFSQNFNDPPKPSETVKPTAEPANTPSATPVITDVPTTESSTPVISPSVQTTATDFYTEKPEESKNEYTGVVIGAAILFVIIVIITIYLILRKKSNGKKRKTAKRLLFELVRIKSFEGYPFNTGETIKHYFENMDNGERYDYICMLFNECFYGGKEPGDEEYNYMNDFIEREKARVISGKNRFKWVMFKIKHRKFF